MQDPQQVKVLETLEGHGHVGLDVGRRQHQRVVLDDLLQVCVHKVEDERHVGPVAEDVQQADDVRMFQLLQQFDLAQRRPVDAVAGLFARAQFDLSAANHIKRRNVNNQPSLSTR